MGGPRLCICVMPKTESGGGRVGEMRGGWRLWLLLLVYNLCFPVLFLVSLPSLVKRLVRRGGAREKFWERFGVYNPELRARLMARGDWIWVHAVSVGEMFIALRFIARIREVDPGVGIVLSTTTSTGMAQARAHAPDGVELIYYPIDFPFAVGSALGLVRPRAVVFVEAAIWPNVAAGAKRRGAILAVVNARVSPRSAVRYRRWRAFVAPLFGLFDLVCAPEGGDIALWETLGVSPSCVVRTGSVKYECAVPDPVRVERLREALVSGMEGRGRRLLLGGSTWPGEEAALARVYLRCRERAGDLLLVVIPRHVERSAEVGVELERLGLRIRLWKRDGIKSSGSCDALVIDVTGELRFWYALADFVFVGKSLSTEGGQNPVEAAVVGKPLVFGEHMENFQVMADSLVSAGAAVRVGSEAALGDWVEGLLAEPGRCREFVGKADPVLALHRGAVARSVDELFRRLPARLAGREPMA